MEVTFGSLCEITDFTPQMVFLGNPGWTDRDHFNLKLAEGRYGREDPNAVVWGLLRSLKNPQQKNAFMQERIMVTLLTHAW